MARARDFVSKNTSSIMLIFLFSGFNDKTIGIERLSFVEHIFVCCRFLVMMDFARSGLSYQLACLDEVQLTVHVDRIIIVSTPFSSDNCCRS